MAGNEHFMFARETALGTWVAPDEALPVKAVTVKGEQPLMTADVTGGGRGERPGAVGQITVAGSIQTLLYPQTLGHLIRGAMTARQKSSAGTGFRNKLLFDDDVAFDSYSMQKRYKADLAESIRGAKITGLTIGCRTKEFATCTMEVRGKDSTITGGEWSDGTGAPAVVNPVPYPATYLDAFKFYQGVMRFGGSVVNTAGELVVSGGSPKNDLENIDVVCNFNMGTDAFGVNLGDRTQQTIDEGAREITVRFEPNFDTSGNSYYLGWKNGEPAVIELYFLGPEYETGIPFEAKITLPHVIYSDGGTPELNRSYGLKRHTVEGKAYVDPVLNLDFGLVLQGLEDYTV